MKKTVKKYVAQNVAQNMVRYFIRSNNGNRIVHVIPIIVILLKKPSKPE